MKNILPGLAQPSGLVIDHLSHDKDVVQKYSTDPLVHNKISVALFHSAMSAADNSLANANKLTIPILLMHGSDDKICSVEGSRQFSGKTTFAELKIWDNGYHELHNEPFRNDVFSYIITWINSRLS
jgi:acylglycerol lipase